MQGFLMYNIQMDKYIAILMMCALILANSAMGFAEDDFEAVPEGSEVVEMELTEGAAEAVPETEAGEKSNTQKQQEFLDRLKEEFNLSKSGYKQLLNSVSDMQQRLDLVSEEKTTLTEQLKNIDDLVNFTTKRLTEVLMQVVESENRIRVLYDEIEVREVALEYQKNMLRDYVRVIYQEQDSNLSIGANGEINAFKLLLADGSVGENLQQLEYFDVLNETGLMLIEKLAQLTTDLKNYQQELMDKKTELTGLYDVLAKEKEQLDIQKAAKENLLNLTLGQEKVYGELLVQTEKEQEELLNDVKALNDAINFVEQKVAEEGENFNPDDYIDLLDYKTKALIDFKYEFDGTFKGFQWPVEPFKGLSAYFKDPGYVGVFGVQHNAIDIPQYQGTPVRAAADGVIFTAKDNGYGYSYIVIAHADGFSTVYGHVSSILVTEGDTISAGSIIALSGGMPGTKGAGYMTTGPHLHLEMLLNGSHVDPLKYLSLDVLTEEQIEALPEKYQEMWEEQILGIEVER